MADQGRITAGPGHQLVQVWQESISKRYAGVERTYIEGVKNRGHAE